MARKSLVAVFALFLLAAGALWVLSRESTLLWVVRQAESRTAGNFAASGTSGSLLGAMRFSHLNLRTGEQQVSVDDARVRWRPWALLWGRVALGPLEAHAVTLDLPVAAQPASQPPKSLAPPLSFSLERLHIDHLAVKRGGVLQQQVSDVSLALRAGAGKWRGEVLSLATPWGALKGRAEIGAEEPFQVDGSFELVRQNAPSHRIVARLEGTLRRFTITASGKAQNALVQGFSAFTPYGAKLLERLEATASPVNPRDWNAAAPAANLQLALRAEGSEEKALRGELVAANSVPGTFDRERLPLVAAKAVFSGDPGSLAVSELLFDFGSAGRLAGEATVRDGALDAVLRTDNLNLRGMQARLSRTRLAGEIAVAGDAAKQEIKLALAQRDYRFGLDAVHSQGTLTVNRARARARQSEFAGKGSIALDERKAFSFSGTLTQFDPAQFGNYPRARINSRFTAAGEVQPVLQLRADVKLHDSTLFGLPSQGSGRFSTRGIDKPDIALDVKAKIGDTQAAVKGSLVDPAELRSLDLQLVLSGRDLAQLYPILGVPLPHTPDYELAGRLLQRDQVWELRKFAGRVGASDFAGEFLVDRRKRPQFMRAAVLSDSLHLEDLAGFIGSPADKPARTAAPGRVLPDDPYDLQKLKAADADIRFTGRRIVTRSLPLQDMSAHLVIAGGRVELTPLNFGVAGGSIVSQISMDAREPTIATAADIQVKQLKLDKLVPNFKLARASMGDIEGRARLTGRGNSIAAMLGSADGELALLMNGGEISDLMLRLANLDVANAAATWLRGDRPVPVRCLVGDFTAEGGHLRPRTLLLDTEHTRINGGGEIDLKSETLNLKFEAKPKDNSLFALRGPIQVGGKLGDPAVRLNLAGIAARGGAAALLGIVAAPLAAILPFVQHGRAGDVDCAPLVASARQFIDQPGEQKLALR